jgi:hypothetical protein
VALAIREQIRTELNVTAWAGVAPNKFLAKIASDWKKPDGLFVIQPDEVDSFLSPQDNSRLLRHFEFLGCTNLSHSIAALVTCGAFEFSVLL